MDDGSVLTADELISRSGDLGAAALQQANAILIPGTLLDAAAIYAICSYLEHMFEPNVPVLLSLRGDDPGAATDRPGPQR